jgi:DNA-binding CsgD family transcriptional regulator
MAPLMANPMPDDTERAALTTSPFIGRESELLAIRGAFDRSLAGRGQVVLLAGEAGIGKSRTAQELAVLARERGALVLWGRCREWEGAPPYWPWVQVARSCLRVHDPVTLLPDPDFGVAALAQLVPELRPRVTCDQRLPSQPEVARFLLFDTLTQWLAAVAERQPLALVLDDLHRADTPSLLLLQFASAGLVDSPVMIVGAWRDGEVGRDHPLTATLAELTRTLATLRLNLRGWAPAETERFTRLSGGRDLPAPIIAAIQRETEGNPLFVTETLRMLADEGLDNDPDGGERALRRIPETVREVILQRLERLSAGCRDALASAAVVGREVTLSTLQLMTDQSPAELLDALDEARRSRILEETEPAGGYRFTHVLIRETLADGLAASDRASRHLRAGQAIERLVADNPAPRAADLAHHFAQALPLGDAGKAISYARLAGEWAIDRVAWEDAVLHFERALSLLVQYAPDDTSSRCDLLLALGEARWNGGAPDEARAAFRVAAELARDLESPERFARAALGVAGEDVVGGGLLRDQTVVALLDEALAVLGAGDSRLRVRLLCQLAFALSLGKDTIARQLSLTTEALETARRLGDARVLAQALDARWYAFRGPDGLRERQVIVAEQFAVADTSGNRYGTLLATGGKAHDALEIGDLATYRQQTIVYQGLAAELQLPVHNLGGQFLAVIPPLIEGRLADADRWVAEATPDLVRTLIGDLGQRMVSQVALAVRGEQGRTDEALEIATRFAATARDSETCYWSAERVILLRQQGRVSESEREFATLASDDFADIPRDGYWLNTLCRLGEAAALLDDTQRATVLYGLLRPYSERNATRFLLWMCHGSVSHYLGLLATTLARWEDAERHFADALAMHERMGARLFATWTRAAWAETLARRLAAGDRERALDLATRALADAESIGSIRIEAQMQELLDVLPEDAKSATPYGLSPRELDVLRLIIEGKTDREIAAALFISHRTVMRHVTGVLNKLGVSSRTAAATLAVRNGIL